MNRNRVYFALMGGCVGAVIIAWTVVRLFSVTAAVVISVLVGLVPPVAAIVANAGDESSRHQPGASDEPGSGPSGDGKPAGS